MNITSIEKMEEIVNNNKSLSWDGWTVINKYKSEKGRTSKYGKYIDGAWYMTRRFVPGKNGWEMPERFTDA